MLKSKKIVDWLYDYSLYFIIGALLLVIIAIEPSFVRVSNFTTILTQSATKVIYACGIAGIIVLGGTDLALGREVGLAAVVAASLLQAVDYSQRVFSADQVPALPLIVPLLLVMVLLGIICAAHGFIVAHWGVAPFVASLGVQLISYGLCLQYFNTVCNSNPLSGFTKTYSKFCQGTIRIGNISLSYLMFYASPAGSGQCLGYTLWSFSPCRPSGLRLRLFSSCFLQNIIHADTVCAVFLHVLHQCVVVILAHRRRAVFYGFAASRKVRNNILRSGPPCVVVIQTEDDFADSREIIQERIQRRIVRTAQRQIVDTAPRPGMLHEL